MEILEQILNIVTPALGAVLTVLLGYFITYINVKKKQLQGETDSATAQKYIRMIADTVTKCVETVNQTYVDALKKEGAFTPEAQKVAFEKCYNQVIALLSDECKVYIRETFTDLEQYLTMCIESAVKESKTTAPVVVKTV